MKKIKNYFFSRGINLKIFFQKVKILNIVILLFFLDLYLIKFLNVRLPDWLTVNRFISRIQ